MIPFANTLFFPGLLHHLIVFPGHARCATLRQPCIRGSRHPATSAIVLLHSIRYTIHIKSSTRLNSLIKLLFFSHSLARIHCSLDLSPANLTAVRACLSTSSSASSFGCNFCSARGPTPEQLEFPTAAAALRSDSRHQVRRGEYSELFHIDARISGGRFERLLI